MKKILQVVLCGVLAVIIAGSSASCQANDSKSKQDAVTTLLLSDFHFDPFHDPGKVQQLVNAPASKWGEILASPATPGQTTAFAALQRQCGARGVDTPYELLQSSLRAAHAQAPQTSFITVTGDFVAHGFSCRYATVVPGQSPGDYAAFVEKTIEYVTEEVRRTFPAVPIYAALGNNDSACGDYRLDGNSSFLAAAGRSLTAALPKSDQKKILSDFAAGGYYSTMMASPMQNTRVIVLDDLFMSRAYATCGGKQDTTVSSAQLAWLQKELTEARQRKQKVWVIGHIPPGVDIYATFSKMQNVCEGAMPQMFLASNELAEVLVANADVIRLSLFAHTHMDELRLLESENDAAKGHVAIKMVSSISPVDGNNPSFTVAQVDPSSATLVDYQVFAASNQTGVDTSWSKEYDYAQTYHQPSFSAATLDTLLGEFRRDPDAKTDESQAYIHNFFVGDSSSLIKPLWPQYVCGLSHSTAKRFTACVCSAAH
jgi:sphingomyelin phosphodiesterase acid-like 3